jgi:hypothetical protein
VDDKITAILEKFPFMSYGRLTDCHYLGIVQNSDNQLISMYILDSLPDEKQRVAFLRLGEEWWWESNRQIPINIFHKDRWRMFRPCLKHFARKDFELIAGPSVSLQETIARRVRKRQVTLIRRID